MEEFNDPRIEIFTESNSGGTVSGKVNIKLDKPVNAGAILISFVRIAIYPQYRFRHIELGPKEVVIYEEKKVLAPEGTYSGNTEYPYRFAKPKETPFNLLGAFIGRLPDTLYALMLAVLGISGGAYNILTPPIVRKISESATITEGGNMIIGIILLVLGVLGLTFILQSPRSVVWRIRAKLDVPLGMDITSEMNVS